MKMTCFGGITDRKKGLTLISTVMNYQILTTANLQYTAGRI